MQLLFVLLVVPVLSLVLSFGFNNKNEKAIFMSSIIGVWINFVILIVISINWWLSGFEPILIQGPMVYHSEESELAINLFLDGYGLVYLIVATILTGEIIVFSRSYLHRESGFKRFFTNVKFFYFGLIIVLLAGNLETLFVGWEIIGVTSFFLIGFYRERYLPVKNALKVVSLYRIADVALLLAIWLCHHYFGQSINFLDGNRTDILEGHMLAEPFYQYAIPVMFLLAAMVKSAQFPFSSWLPRAMEGPTTSSAIFYGSLSVHIGVFFLIRTASFWESNLLIRYAIGGIGLITVITSTFTASVQSTIKTQVAYSSISQIGLMFIELAFGLYWLAIFHFVGNALLRSYQLLISPSVLSYKIHDQVFHFNPPKKQGFSGLWNRIKLTMFVLSMKEFNLDTFMYRYLWNPFKRVGNWFYFVNVKIIKYIAIPVFIIGLTMLLNRDVLPSMVVGFLSEIFGLLALILVLRAFVSRRSARKTWLLVLLNQLYLALVFGLNERFSATQIYIFLSGIVVAASIGFWVIYLLGERGKDLSLNQFNGYVYDHPKLAFVFAIACLGIAGFPITPTFIGLDLMLSHIHENQFFLLILITLNLILNGLVIYRVYSRLFLGQHISDHHDFAYRSS